MKRTENLYCMDVVSYIAEILILTEMWSARRWERRIKIDCGWKRSIIIAFCLEEDMQPDLTDKDVTEAGAGAICTELLCRGSWK